MNLQIHSLNLARVTDYLCFFDHRAFCDNPDWAGCYCVFNHFDRGEDEWMRRSAAENREEAIRLIHSGALNGYLAYAEDTVVGWCNAGGKQSYARIASLETPCKVASLVCAVTCFVIDRDYRRQGIARTLLDFACLDLASRGFEIMEAYPVQKGSSCAAHYHGHPAMFAAAGFRLSRSFGDFDCVQKVLHRE